MPSKPDRSAIWLAKYLSLALTLPASLVAGFILGSLADHYLHLPVLKPVGILLGLTGGLLQLFKELSRDGKRQ